MQLTDQILFIRAMLDGASPSLVDDDHLDEPWRSIHDHLAPGDGPAEIEAVLRDELSGRPHLAPFIDQLVHILTAPLTPASYPSLHDLASGIHAVRWLWPGWLPRGLLSLLGGEPGAGKSLVALDLARRVIHGLPLPDGAPVDYRDPAPAAATALYVDSEMVPELLHARASAWGVDTRRLFALLPPAPSTSLNLCDRRHRHHLLHTVARVRPELVVVDSLASSVGNGEHNLHQVRALLSFLASLARSHSVALLLVHHLRKRPASSTTHSRPHNGTVTAGDFRGFGHITAVARSVLALSTVPTGPTPDPDGPRRLQVVKTNLCVPPSPLGVHFEPGAPGAPSILYGHPPTPYRPPTQVDACADWLVDTLAAAGRPLRPKDIVAAGAEAGFKFSVLYQARRRLEGVIVDTETKYSPHNCWRLAPGLDVSPTTSYQKS